MRTFNVECTTIAITNQHHFYINQNTSEQFLQNYKIFLPFVRMEKDYTYCKRRYYFHRDLLYFVQKVLFNFIQEILFECYLLQHDGRKNTQLCIENFSGFCKDCCLDALKILYVHFLSITSANKLRILNEIFLIASKKRSIISYIKNF